MKGKKALDALCVCIVLLTLLSCASAFVQADYVVAGNAIPTTMPPVPQVPHVPGVPHIFPSPTATPVTTAVPSPAPSPLPTPSPVPTTIITPVPSPAPTAIPSPSLAPAPTTVPAQQPVSIPVLPAPSGTTSATTATVTATATATVTPSLTPTPIVSLQPTEEPRVFHSDASLAVLVLIFIGVVAICVLATEKKHKK